MTSNNNVATIIGQEWWLDEGTVADLTNQFPQQFKSLIKDLVRRNSLSVQVVVVSCKTTALVTRFEQFWGVRIVPALLAIFLAVDIVGLNLHHPRNHALVVLALRNSAQVAGKFNDLGTLGSGSHCVLYMVITV